MRRFRNPRYAPEGLERKLNPSGFAIPVAAEYSPAITNDSPAAEALAATPPMESAAAAAPVLAVASSSTVSVGTCHLSYDPPPTIPDPSPTPGTGEPPWEKPPTPTGPCDPD